MSTIEVDFEVFREITYRREMETMTENDVIRKLLGLPPRTLKKNGATVERPWVSDGVEFPHGAEFRAMHKREGGRREYR